MLYLLSADEIDVERIPNKTFVIYHGHHGDQAVKRADLVIPTSCFTEKEGVYVNLEGRPQISRQVKMPLPNILHSWDFFKKISSELNFQLEYENFKELRQLMFNNHNHLSKINSIEKGNDFKVKVNKKLFNDSGINSNIKNFYMTDSVSRQSPTMASCSLNIL